MIKLVYRENESADAVRSVENRMRDILLNMGMFSSQIDAVIPIIKGELEKRIEETDKRNGTFDKYLKDYGWLSSGMQSGDVECFYQVDTPLDLVSEPDLYERFKISTCSEPSYEVRWGAQEDHYDDKMYNLWLHVSKPLIYAWIEENKPGAWFKEMFNPNSKA